MLIIQLASDVSAFEYNNIYYITGGTGTNIDTDPPSFFSENGNVILNLNMRSSFNATSFPISYNGNFESPYSTVFGITSETITSNSSCLNLGTATKSYTSGQIIESRTTMTNDADSATIFSQSSFNVTTTERFIEVFSYNNTDSEGFVPNIYRVLTGIATEPPTTGEITTNLNSADFGDCSNTGTLTRFPGSYSPTMQQEFAYVVVNSTSGVINYSMTVGAPAPNSRFVYYPIDDTSAVTNIGTGLTISGSVTLDQNRLYVFAYGTVGIIGSRSAPIMNFIIDLGLADYVCPAFGPCVDGFQTRECIDANGLQPNRIDNQACSLIILQNATLGFEEFISTSDILKCEPQWFFGCSYTITNVTLDRPLNWTIIDPAYGGANFLQMTQEYATEGTRSLKMWQIPPKQGEVLTNDTCGNLTTSVIPQVLQGVSNNTFSVSHNVTFPSSNMQISFDVKKCSGQVVQHTALTSLFDLITLCPEHCYSDNCTTEPKGRYVFNVLDTTTGQSIFGVPQYRDSEIQTLSPTYSIANLGIVVGRTYNIIFAISNENPNDATGNCVYIDNVRYQVTEQSLLEFVPDCESRCTETTRIEATLTQSGSCFIVTQEDSPLCTDQATTEAIDNQENFCRDTATLRTFNEKTGKYESVICSTGFVCDPLPPESGTPGSCITEEEAELDDIDSAVPAEDTAAFLDWFNWLFSPLFIFLIITFILAGIISKATTGTDGKGTFEIFGTVIIIMIIIGSLPGIAIVPIWISVAIIVVVALLMAQIMGIFGGKT